MGSKIAICTPQPKVFNVEWREKKNRKKWMKVAPSRQARGNSKSPMPQTSQVPPQINQSA